MMIVNVPFFSYSKMEFGKCDPRTRGLFFLDVTITRKVVTDVVTIQEGTKFEKVILDLEDGVLCFYGDSLSFHIPLTNNSVHMTLDIWNKREQ